MAIIYGADERQYAFVPTTVQTAAYAGLANQYVPCDTTGGAFTVTLPAAPVDRTVFGVELVKGAGALTFACSGTDVLNIAGGPTSATLTGVNQVAILQYSAAAGIWYVFANTTAGFLPLTGGTMSGPIVTPANYAAQPAASGNTVLSSNIGGVGAFDTFRLTGDGTIAIGTGSASRDASWGRTNTAQMGSPNADIAATSAGKGFRAKEGSNAKQGTATLASGTVVVANTSVTANSRIFLTTQSPSGTVGAPYVSARTAGTSFTISSTNAADNSVVAYEIFEPA